MKPLQKIKFRLSWPRGRRRSVVLYLPRESDPSFWRETAEKYLGDSLPGLETIPSSSKTQVQAGSIGGLGGRRFFKRLYPRDWLDYLKQIFRSSRAYRDAKGARIAASRGLSVPEVDCVIEVRQWGFVEASVVVTREASGSRQLGQWLEALNRRGAVGLKRELARALGMEMARWHCAGLRHGDARETNILCAGHNEAASGAMGQRAAPFIWLDNERSRPVWRRREFIRNLIQLNKIRGGVTRADRLRFWKAYWTEAGRLYYPVSEKAALRKILSKSRRYLP